MIRKRERNAIVQSLAAGVVPALGLQHIQVGRVHEVEAVISDLQQIQAGGAAFRLIVGRFGSGKTFFVNLLKTIAVKRKLVVVQADITSDRRLHGTGGKARSLFSELIANMTVRSSPEGGALRAIIERWIEEVTFSVSKAGGSDSDVTAEIVSRLRPLRDLPRGFDFSRVLACYYEGFQTGNEALQQSAVRWLRAEYSTKTEAKNDLGVRSIIGDSDFYDALKLLAAFTKICGLQGLLVVLDELVVLSHRLNSTQARNNNYEQILRILNDCLQGRAEHLGFLFAATDECLEDERRGLCSYEALATRLAPNRFARGTLTDMTGPVIRLNNLTAEDCYVLLENVRRVFSGEANETKLLPDAGIQGFLESCHQRMGDDYFRTPRDTVMGFLNLLQILEQNPEADWQDLLKNGVDRQERPADATGHSDLADFRL